MDNKSATPANQSSANQHSKNNNDDKNNIKNKTAYKKLRVLIHFLYSPKGVTEKSINEAARVMSGRNYPTYIQREHDILLAYPVLRKQDKENSYYSIYQLKNAEQAHKLVDLIIHHCKRFELTCIDEVAMRLLADKFPDRGEVAA